MTVVIIGVDTTLSGRGEEAAVEAEGEMIITGMKGKMIIIGVDMKTKGATRAMRGEEATKLETGMKTIEEATKKETEMTTIEEGTKIETGMTVITTEETEDTATRVTEIIIRSVIIKKVETKKKPLQSFTKEGRGTLDLATKLELMICNRSKKQPETLDQVMKASQ
jgi:hypothetical protein